jgi:hypothetical protein
MGEKDKLHNRSTEVRIIGQKSSDLFQSPNIDVLVCSLFSQSSREVAALRESCHSLLPLSSQSSASRLQLAGPWPLSFCSTRSENLVIFPLTQDPLPMSPSTSILPDKLHEYPQQDVIDGAGRRTEFDSR